MKKLLHFLSVIALLSFHHSNAQNNLAGQAEDEQIRIVKAYYSNMDQIDAALPLCETNGIEMFFDKGYMVFEADDKVIKELESMGFRVVPDDHYNIYHTRSSDASRSVGGISGYPCYNTVEEGFAIMDDIVKKYPEMAEIIDIGDSWEKTAGLGGYDLRVLKLTNKNIPGPKPKFFIEGSIHAREYTTAQLVIKFTQQLVENYGTDPDITWMLDHHEVHALYFVNPDGRKHAEAGQLWRKNTNQNYCGKTSNRRGCDLNRNFDRNWSKTGSSDPCNITYYGPSPASEPEVKAVQNYASKIFANNKGVYIDFHSYGQVIYYIRSDPQKDLSGRFEYFNDYNNSANRGGQTHEWGYYHSNAASFLFELGTAFFQSCSFFENDVLPKNLPAMLYALRIARNPGVTPYGPDAINLSIDDNNMLRATIDDTRYSPQSNRATQTITEAEFYIDVPPWMPGAQAFKMLASDGNFDEKTEGVEAQINQPRSINEKHMIYVRGKDASGVWGPVSGIFLDTQQPPVASFTADNTQGCGSLSVTFNDNSSFSPAEWYWDFGDGNTSNEQNPTHTYNSPGNYTVTLKVSNAYGEDTAIQTGYISVGTGTIYAVVTGGATDTAMGGGGFYTSQRGLYFDALEDLTIEKITIYAQNAGISSIQILDANQTEVLNTTVTLNAGKNIVDLNASINKGSDYLIQSSGSGLYRNNAGLSFPYALADLGSITRSNAQSDPTGFYYFFYNWQVRKAGCNNNPVSIGDQNNNQLKIYPNPFDNAFSISFEGAFTVVLWDLTGRKLLQKEALDHLLLGKDLSSGVYIAEIISENFTERIKLIKSAPAF